MDRIADDILHTSGNIAEEYFGENTAPNRQKVRRLVGKVPGIFKEGGLIKASRLALRAGIAARADNPIK